MLGMLLLAGCAANQLPGYQNTYYTYNVPEPLLDQIRQKFLQYGLPNARIARDNVGRVRLAGSYRNEEEVDKAFIIVQTIVGLKSTSPFYPDDVKEKRWDVAAGKAMENYAKANPAAPARKRALVIGINTFREGFPSIQGKDDAVVASAVAAKAGYTVTALLEQEATKSNIEAALRKLEAELGPNDSLFIYVSSHGTQPLSMASGGDDRKMSIVAWDSGDARLNDKVASNLKLHETTVPDTLLQNLAKRETKNTRIMIDTCFSGEMLRGVPDSSQAYILKTNGGQPERAGVALSAWTKPEFVSKGIRVSDASDAASVRAGDRARANASIADLPDRTRAYTIITATSEGQQSLGPPADLGTFELSKGRILKGSFFTQAFFAYLDDYNGQVEPAFDEARIFTSRKARLVTGNRQDQIPRHYSTETADRNRL